MGKFVMKQTATGYKFDLKAENGETIGVSEVYTTEAACRKGIASVIKNAPAAKVEDQTVEGFTEEKNPKFEIYLDKAGEFRFRLKAANGQIITSSEGYKQKSSCKTGIGSVRKSVEGAEIIEKTENEEKKDIKPEAAAVSKLNEKQKNEK